MGNTLNISVLKGSFARTLGLAAITGAGLGLAFTVFRNADSAWFIIPFLVVTLGMSSLIAGWMAPRLRYALFFPVSALVGFCIAASNSKSLTYDSGFFIVIPLTLIYGGAASLLFVAGWIARQCYRRFRGREITTSRLAIVSLVIVCYSIGLSISFYTWIPFDVWVSARRWSPLHEFLPIILGLVGTLAGVVVIWSDQHRGRWRLVGLILSILYMVASVAHPLYQTTAKLYGPAALVLTAIAVWNIRRGRSEEENPVSDSK